MRRLVAVLTAAVILATACAQAALAQAACPSYDNYNRAEQRCVTHHEHGEAH